MACLLIIPSRYAVQPQWSNTKSCSHEILQSQTIKKHSLYGNWDNQGTDSVPAGCKELTSRWRQTQGHVSLIKAALHHLDLSLCKEPPAFSACFHPGSPQSMFCKAARTSFFKKCNSSRVSPLLKTRQQALSSEAYQASATLPDLSGPSSSLSPAARPLSNPRPDHLGHSPGRCAPSLLCLLCLSG